LTAAGATSDLTLGGRGTTVTLNELGHTSLVGFTATSIIGALNELKTGVGAVTLDVAYNASAGPAIITVDAGDITWDSTGAYSVVFGLSAATGTADGLHVENGTDYFRLDRAAADQIALTSELVTGSINTSSTLTLQSSGYRIEHDGTNHKNTIYSGGKVTYHSAPIELADDASFTLPTSSSGWGKFTLSENSEYADIRWNGLGDVYVITSSANVDTANTDGKFCLYNDSGTVRVKNRLGTSKRCFFDYDYNINYVTFSATDDFTLKMTANTGAYVLVDWGDLTSTVWTCNGSEQTVAHNYAGAGSYTVKIYGDLSSITNVNLTSQLVSVDPSEMSKLINLKYLWIAGLASATGNIGSLSPLTQLIWLYVNSSPLYTGDISVARYFPNATILYFANDPLLTYTTCTLPNFTTGSWFLAQSCGLSSTEVDNILNDLAVNQTVPIDINVAGTNAARTAASDAAKATLLAVGCTITVNE